MFARMDRANPDIEQNFEIIFKDMRISLTWVQFVVASYHERQPSQLWNGDNSHIHSTTKYR